MQHKIYCKLIKKSQSKNEAKKNTSKKKKQILPIRIKHSFYKFFHFPPSLSNKKKKIFQKKKTFLKCVFLFLPHFCRPTPPTHSFVAKEKLFFWKNLNVGKDECSVVYTKRENEKKMLFSNSHSCRVFLSFFRKN